MPTQFDEAFAKVQKLAAIFESGKDRYLSSDYQEAEVRKDFVDKFFTALGWDVNHDEQTNPYAQEVKVERGVNEGSARKRADYAFLLAPNYRDVRFYVEAKRPSKDFGSADNYHQAIRYGWFTKRTSPFAVLTSFEDFHILDCRLKPNINDTLSRVVERFIYTDYIDSEKFARIYWLFSREAVAGGSLEKFAENRPISKAKRYQRGLFKGGDASPDEDFLEELDGYRQQLAQAFKRANPDLDGETLTEVTQRTLDRLVFTRFLEDKGIESPVIENFGKQDGFWEDFIAASLRLDRKYNGVVFKQHPKLDAPGFKPDEKVFARICEELTDPTSPYNFNVIPIHILGSIYERFLGKVISDGARVVEKPEVRKAGGVYYTPEYIVRYIVENTVGKMIEGKTPEEISKLKFADIACGSGSFLLGVYDVLLKYHAEYYSKNPGKVRKADCVRRDGTLHLSLQKKRDILTNNLFGVDIDRQAVEVAQLSLYLKLLEDETVGTTSEFQDEFHFTLLPSLDKNIVCGNSLIGPDIADGGGLTDEEEKKINPLDYAQRFPTIFRRRISGGELREAAPGDIEHNYPGGMPLHGSYTKGKKSKAVPRLAESEYEGGFDAIVGNPPYVLGRETFNDTVKDYLTEHYCSYKGKFDLYVYFTEQASRLLRQNGRLGYILPNTLLANENATLLRKYILENRILEVLKMFSARVFKEAQVESVVLVLRNDRDDGNAELIVEGDKTNKLRQSLFLKSPQFKFGVYSNSETEDLLSKIQRVSLPLGTISDICIGIQLGGSAGSKHKDAFILDKKADVTCKPVLDGKEINSYQKRWRGNYVKYGNWLHRKRDEKYFLNPKIIIRQIGATPVATFDEENYYTLNTIYNLIGISEHSLKFLLAIINSALGRWFWMKQNSDYKTLFPKIKKAQIESIPIRKIDFTKPAEQVRHNRLVELVEQMLAAKAKLPSAKTEGDRDRFKNKCATLDQQIDALVYELYGLTEEEKNLVECGQ